MDGMDQLLDRTYAAEQAEQDREVQTDLLLEAGQYRTLPALTLTVQESDRVNVTDPVSRSERPRVSFRYFAQVQDEVTGKKGGLGFTISPDKVSNANGRPDSASTKWVQAKNAFRASTGREPATIREVAEFVRDYPVRLRVTRLEGNERFPDPSNFVQSIVVVRD